ncbi:MAG: hypothetical protein J6B04_03350 [Clostridia bacterium]|nr:hypothetical protein [Clostridia bacterium]
MKLYDFDATFDKKLSEFLLKNPSKYSEEEWEELIPKLYEKFGNTKINALGKTPVEYYADMSDEELVKTLSSHLKKGVTVSGFLQDEVYARNLKTLIYNFFNGEDGEIDFAINYFGSDSAALQFYLKTLFESDSKTERKNEVCALLTEKADEVKLSVLNYYERGLERDFALEILAACKIKDDKIFNILIKEFTFDLENIAKNAYLLATYGDEKALPTLYKKIDDEDITYVEYTELKYAIERLGGYYDKERNFELDPYYALIKGQNGSDNNKKS